MHLRWTSVFTYMGPVSASFMIRVAILLVLRYLFSLGLWSLSGWAHYYTSSPCVADSGLGALLIRLASPVATSGRLGMAALIHVLCPRSFLLLIRASLDFVARLSCMVFNRKPAGHLRPQSGVSC